MHRTNFTDYDEYPQAMLIYMRHYGPHFNRKLCDFATHLMTVKDKDEEEPLKAITKEALDNVLLAYNVKLKNNQLYDYVYVANMCKADFLNSSVPDERHLAMYIKDVVDDVDACDGLIFNRWYADMCYKGIAIDWEEML